MFQDSIPSQAEWLPSTNARVDLGKGGDVYAAVQKSDNMEIKPIELPRGPATPLLGMNPKDSRSAHYRNTCTSMLTATLCIPAKTSKQLRCPSKEMNG